MTKLRDERGLAALEFAFALPAFIVALLAVVQLGTVFFAEAGLKTAVGAGARLAAVFPTPSPDEIKAAMTDAEFRTAGVAVTKKAEVTNCTENGYPCYDISMSFKVPIDLIFFNPGDITLNETRRVFLQRGRLPVNQPVPQTSTGTSSSATSAGGTPADQDDPEDHEDPEDPDTTTTGGTTTTTTSGGTTTTTTSSSGNNGSSGNASSGNGNGSSGNGSSGKTDPQPNPGSDGCTKKNGKC